MVIESTGKYGCFDCTDYKIAHNSNHTIVKYCEHEKCPYWDDEKMAKNGVRNYIDWIGKGRPDCMPDEETTE